MVRAGGQGAAHPRRRRRALAHRAALLGRSVHLRRHGARRRRTLAHVLRAKGSGVTAPPQPPIVHASQCLEGVVGLQPSPLVTHLLSQPDLLVTESNTYSTTGQTSASGSNKLVEKRLRTSCTLSSHKAALASQSALPPQTVTGAELPVASASDKQSSMHSPCQQQAPSLPGHYSEAHHSSLGCS